MAWFYGLAALIAPAVWGYLCFQILERIWPTFPAEFSQVPSQVQSDDFLDFQI